MSNMDFLPTSNLLQTPEPSTKFWLLFKIASKARLRQMQKGLIYMNSLDYFSGLKGEDVFDLRADRFENIHAVLRAGKTTLGHSELWADIDGKKFNLGPRATLTAKYSDTKNIMLFCMGCLFDGENGKIHGETSEGLVFDQRFKEFGDHILIIRNSREFSRRYVNAIKNRKGIFKPKHLHKGFGRIEYKNLYSFSGPKGIYMKDFRFEWQREFRFALGVEDEFLNAQGAYELRIGDISDITEISPLNSILEKTINMKRTPVQQIGDRWFALKS